MRSRARPARSSARSPSCSRRWRQPGCSPTAAPGRWPAACSAAAFLPVFYAHLALNDAPALAPVALGLDGAAGVLRSGRCRDYAIAGLGFGLAAATKYTAGIVVVCLIAAAVLAPRDRAHR